MNILVSSIMKKQWLLILTVMALFSCRKEYNCYALDDNGVKQETIDCNCYKQTIKDLENSVYKTDSGATYKIVCEE